MVFAFICQRSIFQTSDKRGNWTGNRLKCCKSTKHNYQKALKLPNRIHILKMLKWMFRSHNESRFSSSIPTSPTVSLITTQCPSACSHCGQCTLDSIWSPGGYVHCVLTHRHQVWLGTFGLLWEVHYRFKLCIRVLRLGIQGHVRGPQKQTEKKESP